jgi:translation initiation factor 5B
MPPRKKNNKKAADDWEAELGETPALASVAAPETKDEPTAADAEEEFPAGGLMAMMRKRQKKKKGKEADEDFVEGEDPPTEGQPDLAEKAPVEASIEDEFALPDKKGKGKNTPAPAKPAKEEDDDDERGADGKVLTKAQKEKLKKEREKQRKKENVSLHKVVVFPSDC